MMSLDNDKAASRNDSRSRVAARRRADASGLQTATVVAAAGFFTCFLAITGDAASAGRPSVVRAIGEAMQSPHALLYGIGGIALVYAVVLVALLFRSPEN
jgi:hypothetical protein